jgi:ubiquinone/menaquinone biosynthesis C-methylase UbiE
LDRRIIAIEQRRFLLGEDTVASQYHTVEESKRWASRYDWSQGGEEWTSSAWTLRGMDPAAWKNALVSEMMLRYIRPGSTVLEIGPGAGRWTKILATVCARVLVADVSKTALEICRKGLQSFQNVEYLLIEDALPVGIPDEGVDFVWSYDVFVHINPDDTARYLAYLEKKLKPSGIGIIHHAGEYPSDDDRSNGWRSYMTARFFAHLVETSGMRVLDQNRTLPHKRGDVITVFIKDRGSV